MGLGIGIGLGVSLRVPCYGASALGVYCGISRFNKWHVYSLHQKRRKAKIRYLSVPANALCLCQFPSFHSSLSTTQSHTVFPNIEYVNSISALPNDTFVFGRTLLRPPFLRVQIYYKTINKQCGLIQ